MGKKTTKAAAANAKGGPKKRKFLSECDWITDPSGTEPKHVRGTQCPPGWQEYGKNNNSPVSQGKAKKQKRKQHTTVNDRTTDVDYPVFDANGETDIDALAAILTGATNNKSNPEDSDCNDENTNENPQVKIESASEGVPEDIWLDNPKIDVGQSMCQNFIENMNSEQKKNFRITPLPHKKPYTIVGEGSKTILGKSWIVINRHSKGPGNGKQYVDCATTVVDWVDSKIRRLLLIRVNNAVHHSGRYESFIPIQQIKEQNVDLELLFRGGNQHIQLIGGKTIDLWTDGEKTFFQTYEPCKKDTRNLPRYQLPEPILQPPSEECTKTAGNDANTSPDSTETMEDDTIPSQDNGRNILFLEENVKIHEATLVAWRQRREAILVEKEIALAKKRELLDQRSNLIERQATLESARTKHLVLQAELKESLATSREKLNRLTMLENEERNGDINEFSETSGPIGEPSNDSVEIGTTESDGEEKDTLTHIATKSGALSDTTKSKFPTVFDSYQNITELGRYHKDMEDRICRSLSCFLPYLDSTQVGDYLTLMLRETYALDNDESGGKERSLRRQLLQNTCLDVLLLAPIKSGEDRFAIYSNATPQFFDPNISLCPYELAGVCADDLCPYQHTRKCTKILARERLPLPSLPSSFLSIEGQSANVEADESTKISNEQLNIVVEKGNAEIKYGKNEEKDFLTNGETEIVNDGDSILKEDEDFIRLPPSATPDDHENNIHNDLQQVRVGYNIGEEEDLNLLPASNSPNTDKRNTANENNQNNASTYDCNENYSFWWSDESTTDQDDGAERVLPKDTKTLAVSISQILEDKFGLSVCEFSKRNTSSTEKILKIKRIGATEWQHSSGKETLDNFRLLGRLVDASRLAIHGGLHDMAISLFQKDWMGWNFSNNGPLHGFAYFLRTQTEMSCFFDQFSPILSCFEEAFATQVSFAIISWSLASYSKATEYEGIENLCTHDLELCLDALRNSDAELAKDEDQNIGKRMAKQFGGNIYYGTVTEIWEEKGKMRCQVLYNNGDSEYMNENELIQALELYSKHSENEKSFEVLDDILLKHYLTNDHFGKAQAFDHNDIEYYTINTVNERIYGLKSFISWTRRNLILQVEKVDASKRPMEERVDAVWSTTKKFLKAYDHSGDSVDTELRSMKAIILIGYTILGCLSNFASAAISVGKTESDEDCGEMPGSNISASNLAGWTLLDGAIGRVLKDMRQNIPDFPFIDLLLAPLYSCSVASAIYLRHYSTAQNRLVDCLSDNFVRSDRAKGQCPFELMTYSELLWSQLVQLRMSLPNEPFAMANPSTIGTNLISKRNRLLAVRDETDDFAWEPSKTIAEENHKLIVKLGCLDIRLRHVVLWGDWMLSSLTEKNGSSQTLLRLFSKNGGSDDDAKEISSASIVWRDDLDTLCGNIRNIEIGNAENIDKKQFWNRRYPPPAPLARLPLFFLYAGKFLTDLNLQGCSLEELPLTFGLHFPNLRNLDISKNDLRELPESFRRLTQRMKFLETLRASHNRLESLHSDTLTSSKQSALAPSLRVLDLSHNQLVSVPSLVGLDNLEVLELQHNALVDMSVADWSRLALRLPSLRILNHQAQDGMELRER